MNATSIHPPTFEDIGRVCMRCEAYDPLYMGDGRELWRCRKITATKPCGKVKWHPYASCREQVGELLTTAGGCPLGHF